ncbi:hypothetical protein SISNIDRAFT_417307 [Sistotremastrum niveocremeum HHB9708]|uniref:Uncharacterized protein n=1 Tax=Sistotremastrum niveocremeum HHB9708 TaxID=1314777 RepID=A0A164PYA6_9AGAM|nr:hypothetical protein SISNIDRAFT_417307 [Sistotremastrum niveocremeum HHB9708]
MAIISLPVSHNSTSLSDVTGSLIATLNALPGDINAEVNVTELATLLQSLSNVLSPATATLSNATIEALATNLTSVNSNLQAYEGALASFPPAEIGRSSTEQIAELISIAATKYDLMTVWAPETWSIVFVFMYAIISKLVLLWCVPRIGRPSPARGKTTSDLEQTSISSGDMMTVERRLEIESRSNLILSTIVLGIQLAAFDLLRVPMTYISLRDYKLIIIAIKLVVLPYALELIFSEPHAHIYIHHILTFALLFLGQITVFYTRDFELFRLGQWWILQASTEQATYLGMLLSHMSNYHKLLGNHPNRQKHLLSWAARIMTFASWIGYFQKLVPIALTIYWLVRMWTELAEASALGRFWLAWCVMLLTALLIMQILFCDQ